MCVKNSCNGRGETGGRVRRKFHFKPGHAYFASVLFQVLQSLEFRRLHTMCARAVYLLCARTKAQAVNRKSL